ncbi:MAG: MBOAT family protein [Coriobacteriia bacterium]|nr:MBOAT family protein [Coriobacteriia bacterium]
MTPLGFATPAFGAFVLVTIAAYRLAPPARRPLVLLAASYLFYASYLPVHALLLALWTVLVYGIGARLMQARESGDERGRKLAFGAGLAAVLGLLGAFKYAEMAAGTLNLGLGLLGSPARLPIPQILAPLGLSYVAFSMVHFLVVTLRGEAPFPRPAGFALYIAFFPTILAGPIKRFPAFAQDLREGAGGPGGRAVPYALSRILIGLGKKLVVAEAAGAFAGPLLGVGSAGGEHPLRLMTAVYAYAFFIYFDFAGYTDIAIGVSRLFGFRIIENFDRPYLKPNLQQFWRSWHISLTRLVSEYVYIPLGGSRRGGLRTALNGVVAMLVVGIWHGAAWHFVAWGLYHGVGLVLLRWWKLADARLRRRWPLVNRVEESRAGSALGYAGGVALTFNFVALGWVLFALPLGQALDVYARLGVYAASVLGLA